MANLRASIMTEGEIYDFPINPEDVDAFVGERLRAIRQDQRIGQQSLSCLLNCSQPTVSLIEAGSRGVRLHELPIIAQGLQIPLKELVLMIFFGVNYGYANRLSGLIAQSKLRD